MHTILPSRKICHNIDDMLLCHRLFLILFVENLNVFNIRGSGQLRSCNSCQSDEASNTAIRSEKQVESRKKSKDMES